MYLHDERVATLKCGFKVCTVMPAMWTSLCVCGQTRTHRDEVSSHSNAVQHHLYVTACVGALKKMASQPCSTVRVCKSERCTMGSCEVGWMLERRGCQRGSRANFLLLLFLLQTPPADTRLFPMFLLLFACPPCSLHQRLLGDASSHSKTGPRMAN